MKIYGETWHVKFDTAENIKKEVLTSAPETRKKEISDFYYFGLCVEERNTIYLNENLDEERMLKVFIHEISHACIIEAGLGIAKELSTEDVVAVMESTFLQILSALKSYFNEHVAPDITTTTPQINALCNMIRKKILIN
jgi:hypothetical protein